MIVIETIATVTKDSQMIIRVSNSVSCGKHKIVLTIDETLITEQTKMSLDEDWDKSKSSLESDSEPVELSIIVPVYNEEPNLDYLFERLLSVLNQLNITYEIICVDDGSKDATLKRLIEFNDRNPVIKVLSLSRNFGKEIALTAGLDYAQGKAIIPIDADLQDPPELIEKLIFKWREGYDVVCAKRRLRSGDSCLKSLTAKTFYSFISNVSFVAIPANVRDFRLLDRRVVEALKKMPERNRFMKGLFAWVGFKQTSIIYDRPSRYQGQTKWNYWKLWNFALEAITSFSLIPLKIWSYVGFTLSFLAFIYVLFLVLRTLIFGIDVPGYVSLMVISLFLGGIQLLALGILGEYIGRIYIEVKGRPLYIVKNSYGISKDY